jgi:hypothetical protein
MKGLEVDYATLASQDTMEPMAQLDRPAVLAVAAHVAGVRLIDNIAFDWRDGKLMPDRGLILSEPSRLGTLP